MKQWTIWVALVGLMVGLTNPVAGAPGAPASQAQVNAGTTPYLWVTPLTLTNWYTYMLGLGNFGASITNSGVGNVVSNAPSWLTTLQTTLNAPLDLGYGIGGTTAGIDAYAGLRVQPGNGTGNGYQFLDQGANNLLNIWGGVGSISLGQNLGDISGASMPFWQILQWGDPVNGGWSHVGYQGCAISDYGIHGGNGGTLEDLPISAQEIATAMPTPPMFMTSTFAGGMNTNEIQITNMIGNAALCGLIAAVTNNGGQFWVHLDDRANFFNVHRDGSAQNLLQVNTTGFPDGSNFVSMVHNYWGAYVMATMYSFPYPTNEVDMFGSPSFGSGYPFFPALTPNSIDFDISKLYDFGLDGLRVADNLATVGGQQAYSRHVADALLYPVYLGNYTTGKVPYSLMVTNGGKGRLVPLATEMMGYSIGGVIPSMMKEANLIDHDVDVSYPFPGAQTNITWQTHRSMQNFRGLMQYEVPMRGPGHFGQATTSFNNTDMTLNEVRLALTCDAIALAKVQFSYNQVLGTGLGVQRPNFLLCVTNPAFLQVLFDKTCQLPYSVFDNGWSNTSAWCRPLGGGSFALSLVNETILFSNLTVNLGACRMPTNTTYLVTDVWSNLLYTVSSPTFTYTNVAPTNCALLVFRPAPQNYGQVPAAVFNWAQIPPYSATVTNYWVGNWTNGTVCAIYSNSASTYAIKQLAP